MGGHILWLDSDVSKVIEDLIICISDKGRLSVSEIEDILNPIMKQAKLKEQHSIMKKMIESGVTKKEIAHVFGYDIRLMEELLSIDENENYDYSQFKDMRPLSN